MHFHVKELENVYCTVKKKYRGSIYHLCDICSDICLDVPCSLWDLSSQSVIEPAPLMVKVQSPNFWTPREFPILIF